MSPLNEWRKSSDTLNASEEASFTLLFAPATPDAVSAAFQDLYDPSKIGQFREYLSNEDIAELVRPPIEAFLELNTFLGEGWNVTFGPHGEFVEVLGRAQAIETLFGIRLHRYSHPRVPNRQLIRCEKKVRLPDRLAVYVQGLFGLNEWPVVPVVPNVKMSCDFKGTIIDPTVLENLYNATGKGGKTATSQGVAAFEDAQFRQQDVDGFQKAYDLPAVDIQVVGPNNGGYFGEASLDTQYITASGRGVPTWFLSQEAFDMVKWCNLVAGMSAPPAVLSISWGGPESGYDAAHMRAGSQCFQKLGLKGISIFAASGDDGTGKQGTFSCKKFDPTWPASSPFVTAVGATYLQGTASTGSEVGWTSSGGGFSSVFAGSEAPYQANAVKQYLSTAHLPSDKLFNSSGRAIPDVSAVGTCYTVYSGSQATGTLSGTSASTPTFAGFVSLINDERVAAGKPTLGFINHILYSSRYGRDVVEGNNKAPGCPAGFPATAGWDAITGWGTPDFPTLRALLLRT